MLIYLLWPGSHSNIRQAIDSLIYDRLDTVASSVGVVAPDNNAPDMPHNPTYGNSQADNAEAPMEVDGNGSGRTEELVDLINGLGFVFLFFGFFGDLSVEIRLKSRIDTLYLQILKWASHVKVCLNQNT